MISFDRAQGRVMVEILIGTFRDKRFIFHFLHKYVVLHISVRISHEPVSGHPRLHTSSIPRFLNLFDVGLKAARTDYQPSDEN